MFCIFINKQMKQANELKSSLQMIIQFYLILFYFNEVSSNWLMVKTLKLLSHM